jgi:primosomal protein N'
MQETLQKQKRILCFYNRKGITNGTELSHSGFGTKKIQQIMKRLFPTHQIGLLQKDQQENVHAAILITTSFFFEYLFSSFSALKDFGLILHLDADLPLYQSSFRATESTISLFEQLKQVAQLNKALYAIQTNNPLFFENYQQEPLHFFSDEYQLRSSYHLPPFTCLIRISLKQKMSLLNKSALQDLKNSLETEIPSLEIIGPLISSATPSCMIWLNPEQKKTLWPFLQTLSDFFLIDTEALF